MRTAAAAIVLLIAALVLAQAPTTRTAPQPPVGMLASKLILADAQLKRGEAQTVMTDIQSNLTRFSSADLPSALHLLGRSRMAVAEQAAPEQKKKLLLQAGLDFMRVVTYFPDSSQAPDCLLLAAKASAAAGDAAGAANGLRATIRYYPQSESAKAAEAELNRTR